MVRSIYVSLLYSTAKQGINKLVGDLSGTRGYPLMRVTRLRAWLGADFAPGRTRGRPGIYVIMVSRSGDAPTGDPLGLIDGADSQRLNRQGTGSACTGASNKEIGGRLCTSLATVKTYIINSYPKPGVSGRVEAWRKRGSRGFISGKGQRLIPAHAGYESLFCRP
ncbi:helix-turn-helix transcriptional regulator [Paenibacillus ehimensis]|uniref:Uncharacterized protein n=1 Tax=Paenibacillus ehimensis TaxID=79264 RepID=A0ABT8VB66_9BACL|nr:hypothetical protein [Paenibacillus ehimensis]MDO3678230.1 hypothetical protein [Paenibacillus ehimensis]